MLQPLSPRAQKLYDWLVQYICTHQYPPQIREMMKAMTVSSPSSIQVHLKQLKAKGYIDWNQRESRTLRVIAPPEKAQIELASVYSSPHVYALQVRGDSLIDNFIKEGDLLIMRSLCTRSQPQNGDIVAVKVEGLGTRIGYFYRQGDKITLKPTNLNYEPIEAEPNSLTVEGVLVGVWSAHS